MAENEFSLSPHGGLAFAVAPPRGVFGRFLLLLLLVAGGGGGGAAAADDDDDVVVVVAKTNSHCGNKDCRDHTSNIATNQTFCIRDAFSL